MRMAFGAAFFLATAGWSQPGFLDPTFDGDGRVILEVPGASSQFAESVVIRDDGRILVAGSADDVLAWSGRDILLVSLRKDGSVDPTFGDDGASVIPVFESQQGTRAVIQEDGRILVAMTEQYQGSTDSFIQATSLTPFGFQDEALYLYPFHLGCGGCGETSWITALLGQPDGKVVLAGTTRQSDGDSDFAVLRLAALNDPDAGFGAQGRVIVDRGLGLGDDGADAAVLQRDGKILLAGYSEVGFAGDYDFAVLRLTADGDVDTSFGSDGWALISFDLVPLGGDSARDLAVQPDGRIVIAGYAELDGDDWDFAVARLTPNGTLDPTFGPAGDGKITVPFNLGGNPHRDFGYAVAVQGDGKILLAGNAEYNPPDTDIVIARLLPDGSLDQSFGFGGKVSIPIDLGGTLRDVATAMALQKDGRIVIAGGAERSNGYALVVLRLQNDYVFADGFESGDASGWSTMVP